MLIRVGVSLLLVLSSARHLSHDSACVVLSYQRCKTVGISLGSRNTPPQIKHWVECLKRDLTYPQALKQTKTKEVLPNGVSAMVFTRR